MWRMRPTTTSGWEIKISNISDSTEKNHGKHELAKCRIQLKDKIPEAPRMSTTGLTKTNKNKTCP
jgi:hypothetical protein